MKMTLTIKKIFLIGLFSISSLTGFAYTAVSSGKWSSASTWGGILPGPNVTLADIVIPSGISVTLDEDVVFSGLTNSLTVNGTLDRSFTHALRIDEGVLAGSGVIDIERLTFNGLATSIFTGTINVTSFINNRALLSLASVVNVKDSCYIIGKTMELASGSNFTMGTNSLLLMWDGALSVTGTGVYNTGNAYDIGYAGKTQTTGIELKTPNLRQLFMWLDDTTQILSLGNDVVVNYDLHLRTGKLFVNGKNLTLKHDVWRLNGSLLMSDASSNIIMQGDVSMTDGLAFAPGSSVNNLVVNMKPYTLGRLRSNLAVVGNLKLLSGNFSVENSGTLTMKNNSSVFIDNGRLTMGGGNLASSGKYELEYSGMADTIGPEIQCGGLYDVTIDLASDSAKLILQNDLNIGGKFDIQKGHLYLSGNDVMINGSFSQSPAASMVGSQNSDIELHLSSSDDTLYLDPKNNILHNLKIDLSDAGTITLGSDVHITSRLDFNKGKINIADHDLVLEQNASVSGYSDKSYIITSGTGKLIMPVNAGGSSVTFPVGTGSGYSPAKLQQAAGSGSGNFMVRVADGVLSKGTAGYNTATQHSVVNRTWSVESAQGVNANLNLKLGWRNSDEVNGFNRNRAYITQYGTRWDNYNMSAAQSMPNNIFELNRPGITSSGIFAVADSSAALAISSVDVADNILLFPNPASGYLTVKGLNPVVEYRLQLIDYTGRVIQILDGSENDKTLDVSELNKGWYFIRMIDMSTKMVTIKPFVKQ